MTTGQPVSAVAAPSGGHSCASPVGRVVVVGGAWQLGIVGYQALMEWRRNGLVGASLVYRRRLDWRGWQRPGVEATCAEAWRRAGDPVVAVERPPWLVRAGDVPDGVWWEARWRAEVAAAGLVLAFVGEDDREGERVVELALELGTPVQAHGPRYDRRLVVRRWFPGRALDPPGVHPGGWSSRARQTAR